MKLNLNERDVKYLPGVKDIKLVKIKNYEKLYEDIEFLDYDYNYKKGYNHNKNAIIITIQHPLGKKAFTSIRRIVNVVDNEFDLI